MVTMFAFDQPLKLVQDYDLVGQYLLKRDRVEGRQFTHAVLAKNGSNLLGKTGTVTTAFPLRVSAGST